MHNGIIIRASSTASTLNVTNPLTNPIGGGPYNLADSITF
jgi:hypothetical protein